MAELESADVTIAHAAVHAQQRHRSKRYWCAVYQSMQVLGFKQASPFSARASRITFLLGRLNPVPYRTGRSINPLSKANLNTILARPISAHMAAGPHVLPNVARKDSKSSDARSTTSRDLPNDANSRPQVSK